MIKNMRPMWEMWKRVTQVFVRQTKKGIREYGQTLADNHKLSNKQLAQMALEEAVDTCAYIQTLIDRMEGD